MLLDLTEEEKASIAIFLRTDRRKKHQTMLEYIINKNGFPICSRYIYSKLENQTHKVEDDVYEAFLADKFNLYMFYDDDYNNIVNRSIKTAYRAFAYYDIIKLQNVISLLEGLCEATDDGRKILWTCLYTDILHKLHSLMYNKYDIFNGRELEDYIAILDALPYHAKEILRAIIFLYVNALAPTIKMLNKICDRTGLRTSKASFNILYTCYLDYFNGRLFPSSKTLFIIEKFYKKNNNMNRLSEVYSLELSFVSEYDKNYIFEFLDKIEDFHVTYKMEETKRLQFVYNKAVAYLQINNYIQAYRNFEDAMNQAERLFRLDRIESCYLPLAIFQNYICTVNNWEPDRRYLKQDINLSAFPERYTSLYRFYLMKDESLPAHELQQYLHKKVLPHTDRDDTILNRVIHCELLKLTKITKNHSPLKLIGPLK